MKLSFNVATESVLFVLHGVFVNRENCQKEAAKLFRKYYRRPYFFPPMAEATEGNFFIVSMGQKKSLQVG